MPSFNAVGALLMLLIAIYVWPIFMSSYEGGYYRGTTSVIEIPIWPFMAAVLIGAVATAIQYLLLMVEDLRRAIGRRPRSMSDIAIGALCLGASLVLIQTGMHIGVALMLLSFIGVWAIRGLDIAGRLLGSSAATSVASDAYAVIPLFVLMGLFVSSTNMGRDTFDVAALLLRRIRGGLGIATVGRQRGLCRLHRHDDRIGVGVHQGGRAGDDPARPHAEILGWRRRREFGARHADPAEHPVHHLRRDRQRLDRRSVQVRHPARHPPVGRLLHHDHPADDIPPGFRR